MKILKFFMIFLIFTVFYDFRPITFIKSKNFLYFLCINQFQYLIFHYLIPKLKMLKKC